jgi:sulfate permease, SulP family
MNKDRFKQISYIKNEALAGLTTSFAMVPETVAFAFVAGVNPLAGLYACFVGGLLAAIFGGRPGMISGGAGSLAVVCAALVATYGIQYLFASVILMGVIQLIIGLCNWGKLIRLVPHPVMLGFVNGLAVVILLAQLEQFQVIDTLGSHHWEFNQAILTMIGLTALTILIAVLLPYLTKAIPASLVAIVAVTILVYTSKIPTHLVQDLAELHGNFPALHLPSIPWTWGSLQIILPSAIILAGVGLTESLLTQMLIDEMTDTATSNDQECVGQGLANIATGFFGGMGTCAMIGQSILNHESGGRKRLSGIVQALCILCYILFASALIGMIPMAALTGVMFLVVFKTFAWSSLRILHKIPLSDAVILLLVSVITVLTNIAIAVAIGVLISALKFAWTMANKIGVRRYTDNWGNLVYEIHGPIFFGSTRLFLEQFTPQADPNEIVVDFAYAHLYDHSSIEAISLLVANYQKVGKSLQLRHLSPDCQKLLKIAGSIVNVELSDEPHRHFATDRLA